MQKTNSVILVESPGNIWKLVENGINNCVASFGTSFSDCQEMLLTLCGITTIYLLTDNDQAGKNFAQRLDKSLNRRYNIIKIGLSEKFNDVAECSNSYIEKEIKPQLKFIL
jgi:DNA primase